MAIDDVDLTADGSTHGSTGDGATDDRDGRLTRMTRRRLLTGLVGAGALVVVAKVVPGQAASTAGRLLSGSEGLTPGATGGSFTASFDFVTGVADVAGITPLPAGTPVVVTVTALLNGAPMPPGGAGATTSVRVVTAADGSFVAAPSFAGATNDNANQFLLTIETEPSTTGLCLSGTLATPEPPVGPAGLTGPTGPTGPAGAPGPDGPTGLAGDTGPNGVDGSTGAAGTPGAPGANGPIGGRGPTGPTGPTGISLTSSSPAVAYVPGAAPGPTGPNGATGPTGPAGAVGPQGASGPGGPFGATGPAGDTGATGAPGAPGAPGATGPAGPAGPTGPTGPIGLLGSSSVAVAEMLLPPGLPGLPGPTGPTGPVGAEGLPGPTGPEGVAGPTGAPGSPGGTGPAGPPGANGAPGGTGPVGPTGPTGFLRFAADLIGDEVELAAPAPGVPFPAVFEGVLDDRSCEAPPVPPEPDVDAGGAVAPRFTG